MKYYRDVDGLIWEEQPDGTFRSYHSEGGYFREPSFELLELWAGPLTELSRCVGCGNPEDDGQAHGYGAEFGGCV